MLIYTPEVRSDVLRTGMPNTILTDRGKEAVVLQFACGYFSFMNSSHMLDRVQQQISSADKTSLIILDFSEVMGVDIAII